MERYHRGRWFMLFTTVVQRGNIKNSKLLKMKYIFRGYTVFEYIPLEKRVVQGWTSSGTAAYNFCNFIPEDYKLLSEFFETAYKHIQGENVELKDIEVN